METLIEVNKKEQNDVLVFEFTGELDETNADKTFKNIYEQIGEFDNKKILFDLKGLKYLNSKSIGYIADVFSNVEDSYGKMCISQCSDGVRDILELVGITSIIITVETNEEAMEKLA